MIDLNNPAHIFLLGLLLLFYGGGGFIIKSCMETLDYTDYTPVIVLFFIMMGATTVVTVVSLIHIITNAL
jgi:hypothetical protein